MLRKKKREVRKALKEKIARELKAEQKAAKKAKKEKAKPSAEEQEVRKSLKPMTKEEWDKQQSVIRKVYDPDTGRTRLVKGDGEILEEIVSEARHREINKTATAGDGASFQAGLKNKI